MFEGGVRVPFAMRWPARIPQGMTYKHPVSALDIFPTAVAAAEAELPTDRAIDGVDLIPYLDGSNSQKPHDRLFWRAGSIWAARVGDWKLIYAADRYWLYDLSKDIGEINKPRQGTPGYRENDQGSLREVEQRKHRTALAHVRCQEHAAILCGRRPSALDVLATLVGTTLNGMVRPASSGRPRGPR